MNHSKAAYVKAIFKGQDGSLDYKHNMEYKLTITLDEEKNINIERFDDGYGQCGYSSMLTFLDNWDNIRHDN